MRIHKPRLRADKLEIAALELLSPVIRKVADEMRLALHHLAEIEANPSGLQAPGAPLSRQVQNFRRVEQRLGGHAATQDAESTDLATALEDGDPQTGVGRRPARRITRTAAAEDCDIKIVSRLRFHRVKMEV